LLLHILVIGALLLLVHPRPMQQAFEPTGVSVVFDAGQTHPSAPRPSPIPTPSHAPPPAAPPAPPPQEEEQPEVNLNLPDQALSPMPEPMPQPAPEPAPPAQIATAHRVEHGARHVRSQHYIVMNNMSVNGTPSPPTTFANKDINLDAGGAPENFANTAQISIQGDPGTNWEAIFNKWVNQHTYYPQAAAEQGQQGSSTISFTVHRDGTVTNVRLLSSAGSPFLDQAWLGIFLQNNVPPFAPDAKDDSVHITATLDYELEP
jgi:protein TonB